MDDRKILLQNYVSDISARRLEELLYEGLKLSRCKEILGEKKSIISSSNKETQNKLSLFDELDNELHTILSQYLINELLKDFFYINKILYGSKI